MTDYVASESDERTVNNAVRRREKHRRTDEQLREWANRRADDAGGLARELLTLRLEHDILRAKMADACRVRDEWCAAYTKLRDEVAYKANLSRLEALMDASAGTPEGDELVALASLIERYEDDVAALTAPDDGTEGQ